MPPFSLKLKTTFNNIFTDSQSEVPIWMSVISVLVGFLLIAIFIAETTFLIGTFGREYQRITIAGGLGLIMGGVGSRASGKWGSWYIVGAAGLTIIFYTMLWWTSEQPSEPAMIGRVSGFGQNVHMVEASADNGERLFGYYQRNSYEFNFRIEETHLEEGCISFAVIAANDIEHRLRVHPTNLRKAHKVSSASNQKVELIFLPQSSEYDATLNYIKEETYFPVSQPWGAGCHKPNEFLALHAPFSLPLVLQAHADSQNPPSEQLLIESIRSEDILRRYDAQRILSTHPPEVISSILNELQIAAISSDDQEFLDTGLVGVIGGMLQRGVNPNEIKKMFIEEKDLEPLVRTLKHRNHIYSFTAMSSLIHLGDDRVNELLLNILKENKEEENNGKYYAAVVLSDGFSTLSDDNKSRLSEEISTIVGLDERTQRLLNSIVKSASILNESPSKQDVTPIGWVYIGINSDNQWIEKYFDWNNNSSLPAKGVIMTANGSVHLRKDYIKFHSTTGRWVNSDVVGLVRSGDKVKVTGIKNVAEGFYWAEITSAN